jgi:hypothetical protein
MRRGALTWHERVDYAWRALVCLGQAARCRDPGVRFSVLVGARRRATVALVGSWDRVRVHGEVDMRQPWTGAELVRAWPVAVIVAAPLVGAATSWLVWLDSQPPTR